MPDQRLAPSGPTGASKPPARTPTGQLGRAQLEAALRKALDGGVNELTRQVRYSLALSQLIDAPPNSQLPAEKITPVPQARIKTLAALADVLDRKQINAVIKEITQLQDEVARLELLVDLALHIPPDMYQDMVRDILAQARSLRNPAARARILFKLNPLLTLMTDEPVTPSDMLAVVALAQSIGNTESRVRSLVALSSHLPQTMSIRLLSRVLDDVDETNNDTLRSNTISAMAGHLPPEIEERALHSSTSIHSPNERARALTALARTISEPHQARLHTAAVEAISQIINEDDRANALVLLAPHLEYSAEENGFPALLEAALAIAISLTRRHLRARALVALAPHLMLDLQGEALAAVHSLSSERDRAALLAELAPTLPPEMLVASLAVAHTMREHDARVHALTVLAHHVPQNAQNQTILDALAAAANLPHHYERVMALVALLDVLPPLLKEQALTNALESTRLIDNENARSRALSLLGHELPPQLLTRGLELAYQINDPQQRLNAVLGMVPYLSGEPRFDALLHLLDCVEQMPFAYKQARALVSVAPHLPPELMPNALKLADQLDDPFDRSNAYIALVQNLPPKERPPLIAKTWALLKRIDDGYDRASALVAIAPFLPSAAAHELAQSASTVIGAIMDEYDQASAITILAPLLTWNDSSGQTSLPEPSTILREAFFAALDVPHQQTRLDLLEAGLPLWEDLEDEPRYQLWRDFAPRMAALPLADVLLCLGVMVRLLRTMGGEVRLKEIAQILGAR
ncbi:MAG: hypothetical protein SF029_12950 [bacterium]|nr:hypothetical protein [bacterium]